MRISYLPAGSLLRTITLRVEEKQTDRYADFVITGLTIVDSLDAQLREAEEAANRS